MKSSRVLPFSELRDKVNQRVEHFFQEKVQVLKEQEWKHREILPVVTALQDFILAGGKRIRPALVYYGYRLLRNDKERELLDMIPFAEFVQAFLLIHDDIIDNDSFRRGKPTVHKIFEQFHKKKRLRGNGEGFGKSVALLVGDLAQTYAIEFLLRADFPEHRKRRALMELNTVTTTTLFGQYVEVVASHKEEATEKDINLIHQLKTAKYTVESPLRIGAIVAGATETQLMEISRFAIPLGTAFQIQDDILGLFGNEQELGKPVGSDIREGKKTLLISKAMENLAPAERKYIQSCLGKQDISKEEIQKIRRLAKKSRALQYSQTLIQKLTAESKRGIEQSSFQEQTKKILLELADYLAKRTY